ncbi:MAG: PAS domain-containing protein, partial [Pontixanthobacter sp.]
PAWSDLPFIVLTDKTGTKRSGAETDRIDALNNVVLLPRPLHGDDLLRAVRSALKARARQYEARERLEELETQGRLLRDSEAKLHAMVNSIDQMVWSTLPDGHHDYFNNRWYEYTGVPAGSTDGTAWNGIFHPDDQPRSAARWQQSLDTGEPYEIEYRLRHRSGEYRWVLGKAQPVRDRHGAITRWYGTCTDIHEQIEAREVLARTRRDLEVAVRERTAELGDMRRERDRAWDTSVDLLTIVRPDGVIQDANPAWKPLMGYDPDAIVGANFLDIAHPDDVDETRRVFTEVFDAPLIEPYVFRMLHTGGTYRHFAWTASAHGGLAYPAGRDVTQQIEQADALAKVEKALRQSQKLETIGQLTGGVAHDFNNLLMAIRSSLELLERRLPSDDERLAGLVGNALKATDRGAGLTQRMLAFARRQELDAKPVDVACLLVDMRDLIERSIGPQVAMSMDLEDDVPKALVDANQLEMAVLNLAVNARDAMDGAGNLSVQLDALEVDDHSDLSPGAYVRVRVTDTGAGMDTRTLAQAMEPFFTTKGVGKGTGLGLSMVHGLANQSGGTFRLHSEVGTGTTASLFLPVAPEEAVPSATTKRAGQDRQGGKPLRILAVDDDVLVLFGTVALLEDLGHAVVEASSGAEAMDMFEQQQGFDLVITDQAMPNMTGVELAQALRKRAPDLPIILASGYAEMPEGAGDAIAHRLEKPFNDGLLRDAIRLALRNVAV